MILMYVFHFRDQLKAMTYALNSFQTCCDRCEDQVIFSCPCRDEDFLLASDNPEKLVLVLLLSPLSENR